MKSTSFELQVTSAAGKWKCFKTYKEVEDFSQQIAQLYNKIPPLAKHSSFEPLFFGQPDHAKATQAAQKFMDLVCSLPYVDYVSPTVEFLEYSYGLDCLNQMSKVREYRNKHGMTLTHFSMESGLELNYALFSRDISQKANSQVNMSVLEGWETSMMEKERLAKVQLEDKKLPLEEIKEVAEPGDNRRTSLEVLPHETKTETLKSDNYQGSTKEGSLGQTNGPLSATGSMENTLKDKLIGGVENLVKMTSAIDLEKPFTGDQHQQNNGDPMKSPRQHSQGSSSVVNKEILEKRDRDSKIFQKKALGIFHKKHISRNIDCCVTCFETFSEADLIIAGLENGKLAAFKEIVRSDTGEFGLELLSRVKVFKEAVTHISLSTTKGVLYCIGDNDTLAVVDLCTWKVLDKHSLGGIVTEFLYNDDYQVAFIANGMPRITLVNLADPKKVAKTVLKSGEEGTTASIKHMDLDSDAGLLFCSDNTSGQVSVFDIDYPFTFQSKITKKSSAFGLSKCKDLSWWEARKEVYCGFKGGIVTVHCLSPAGNLDFITSCRVSSADLNLVAHYGTCPYLFIAASDGCLTLWSPPKRWKTPFDRNTSAIQAELIQNVGQPVEKVAAPKDECYSDDDAKERNHSPANSC